MGCCFRSGFCLFVLLVCVSLLGFVSVSAEIRKPKNVQVAVRAKWSGTPLLLEAGYAFNCILISFELVVYLFLLQLDFICCLLVFMSNVNLYLNGAWFYFVSILMCLQIESQCYYPNSTMLDELDIEYDQTVGED